MGPGKGKHMSHKSQNGTEGGAGPKRPKWSLVKEGIGWEVDPPTMHKGLGSCVAILRRHLVYLTPKLIQSQENKDVLLLLTCTQMVHTPVLSMGQVASTAVWCMASRKESLWLSLIHLMIHSPMSLQAVSPGSMQLCGPSSCMAHGHVDSTHSL